MLRGGRPDQTVVFAAAHTIPGGSNEHGFPVFLFFSIMDVVGLASSLVSVVMFLSILTSPFEMQDFYRSLPRKLTLGFTLLFFSLTSTMLALTAAILLTIRLDSNKWTWSLITSIYSAAFFPVTIFGLMQFPIYVAIKGQLKPVLKKFKKIFPSRWIKSHDKPKIKKIKYRYILSN
ncbi:hypothetical protein L6164_032271 [Bauhinia variegata]|uniref:Uncharacterized protein n=1 Tax=Bauhinia variegata TaxID=167791 RepID=A0ACB9KNB5_BAUVA|nr:hypothetical protein L6164_032271 [Bauhinia variegata]